jgi:Big-like domain-containing protein
LKDQSSELAHIPIKENNMKRLFKNSFISILISLTLIASVIGVIPAYAASGAKVSNTSQENGFGDRRDHTPPAAPVVNEPPSVTNDTTPTIGGTAEEGSRVNVWYLDDQGNRVQICRNVRVDDDDEDAWKHDLGKWSCNSSKVLPEGEIHLVVNATKGHNVSADTSYLFTISTDTSAPAAPVVTSPVGVTDNATPTISGTAEPGSLVNVWYLDDQGNPVQICQDVLVDSSGNWSCDSSVVLPEGQIDLVVNATDAAGNTSEDASYSFTVNTSGTDTTPPTITSLVRASADPTSDPSVDYTLTFSEPVSGVDVDDFTLNMTGTLTGAFVSDVTGSDDTYTVTVNTGTGDGTLGLEIPDTATITDLAGNPLAGLPYTGGEVFTVSVQNFEKETIGVFSFADAGWNLRNSNSSGDPDISVNYGISIDYPVVGDWDGDGVDTIGVYRDGVFYLSNSDGAFADIVFAFGVPGDQPIAGDWDGDGIDTVGLYRSSTITFFLRNSNSSGAPDITLQLGLPGDVGLAGDWNGDGFDTIGVFRPSNGTLFLKNTNEGGFADIAINYGIPGDKPVTGDWDNDGIDTIGVYREDTFYLRNSNTAGFADLVATLTTPGDLPVAGNWDGLP